MAAGTKTPGIEQDDYGFSLNTNYETRDWRLAGTYREIGDGFNPEVGFLPRRGYRHAFGQVLRKYRFSNVEWFRELRPHVVWQQFWDFEGFTQSSFLHVDSHFEFQNGAFFQLPAINFVGEGLKEPFEISEGVVIPPGEYDWVGVGFPRTTPTAALLCRSTRRSPPEALLRQPLRHTTTLNYATRTSC